MTRQFLNIFCFVALVSFLADDARAETVTYYSTDHLGSPDAAMDGAGNVVWRESYGPYGDKRIGPSGGNNDTGYTGHQSDTATGFTYMQARYYDPAVGRFMAVDPVKFRSDSPISFNVYAYANNNPFRYSDPDGENPVLFAAARQCAVNTGCRSAVGGAVGFVVGAVSNAVAEITDNEPGFNFSRYATNTVTDGVTGAAMAARPDKANQIAAAAGAIEEVATDAANGELSTDTIIDATNSAATNVLGSHFGGKIGAGNPFPVNEVTSGIAGTAITGVADPAVGDMTDGFKDQGTRIPPGTAPPPELDFRPTIDR